MAEVRLIEATVGKKEPSFVKISKNMLGRVWADIGLSGASPCRAK